MIIMDEKEKELIQPMTFYNEDKEVKDDKTGLIQPITFKKPDKKHFEEKIFIILYKLNNIDDNLPDIYSRIFTVCIGRTAAYHDIQTKIMEENVDILNSIITTEVCPDDSEVNDNGDYDYYLIDLPKCLNIYKFCKGVEGFYADEEFRIDKFIDSTNISDYNSNIDELITDKVDQKDIEKINQDKELYKLATESMNRSNFIDIMTREFNNKKDSGNV